jgi:hypothetical protein
VPLADRVRDEFLRLADRSGWHQCPLCGNRVGATPELPAPAPVERVDDACEECGGAVPTGAGFCPWCGDARSVSAEPEVEPLPPSMWETAEIGVWRGYVKSHFYALARDNGEAKVLAESDDFRLRGREVRPETEAVRAAHTAVVEALVAAGWEEVDSPGPWYALRFRRPGNGVA